MFLSTRCISEDGLPNSLQSIAYTIFLCLSSLLPGGEIIKNIFCVSIVSLEDFDYIMRALIGQVYSFLHRTFFTYQQNTLKKRHSLIQTVEKVSWQNLKVFTPPARFHGDKCNFLGAMYKSKDFSQTTHAVPFNYFLILIID